MSHVQMLAVFRTQRVLTHAGMFIPQSLLSSHLCHLIAKQSLAHLLNLLTRPSAAPTASGSIACTQQEILFLFQNFDWFHRFLVCNSRLHFVFRPFTSILPSTAFLCVHLPIARCFRINTPILFLHLRSDCSHWCFQTLIITRKRNIFAKIWSNLQIESRKKKN
jgi:hypothetical protein